MLEPNDFFQQQIQQCSGLAANAVGKSDRDFWLRLARRWEDLLRAKQSGSVEKLFKKLGSSVQYSQRNDLQNDLQNGGRPDARIGEFCAAPEKRDRPFIRASTSRPCGTSMQFVGWVSPSRYQGHDAIDTES